MKIKRTKKYMSEMGTALNGNEIFILSEKQLEQYSKAVQELQKGNDKLWKEWIKRNITIIEDNE